MINLRYHIVSLTAVFLAIGIGLTLGSTFLDRATVENLQGQLQGLEARLGEREERIGELEEELAEAEALQSALDEQGPGLLAGRLDAVPVVVVTSEGVDEVDVEGAVESLQAAGAQVQGQWQVTERMLLAEQGDIDDLAAVLEEPSSDPARLRRLVVDGLGRELQERQRLDVPVDVPVDEAGGEAVGEAGDDVPTDGAGATEGDAPGSEGAADEEFGVEGAGEAAGEAGGAPLARALAAAGFITFEPVGGGPDTPTLPAGVRVVLVGGSSVVPDDVFIQPLVERIAQGADDPSRTVVASAMGNGATVSEVVAAIRADEQLRAVVSTVDRLDHFQGWMATVLAVEDLALGIVGHYGLGEGASALLPPLRVP